MINHPDIEKRSKGNPEDGTYFNKPEVQPQAEPAETSNPEDGSYFTTPQPVQEQQDDDVIQDPESGQYFFNPKYKHDEGYQPLSDPSTNEGKPEEQAQKQEEDLSPYAPVLEYLEKIKPQPNKEDEKRQKQIAKFNALGEALSLVANGIGATQRGNVIPLDNKPGLNAYNRYMTDRLKYKADTDAWKNNYLKSLMQAEQYRAAQQAQLAREGLQREWEAQKIDAANKEWDKRNELQYGQRKEMAGIQEASKAKDRAIRVNEGEKDRENSRRNTDVRLRHSAAGKLPFQIRLTDGTMAGLSDSDARQIFQAAKNDPEMQKILRNLRIESRTTQSVSQGELLDLLNHPETLKKFVDRFKYYNQYDENYSDNRPAYIPYSDLETIVKNNPTPAKQQTALVKRYMEAGYSKEQAIKILTDAGFIN